MNVLQVPPVRKSWKANGKQTSYISHIEQRWMLAFHSLKKSKI